MEEHHPTQQIEESKSSKYQRAYRLKHPWVRNYYTSKTNAKRYGRENTLTVADVKALWERDKADQLEVPSIDRIDNAKGYIEGNCRFIERSENCRIGNLGRKNTENQKDAGRRNLIRWHKEQNHNLSIQLQ